MNSFLHTCHLKLLFPEFQGDVAAVRARLDGDLFEAPISGWCWHRAWMARDVTCMSCFTHFQCFLSVFFMHFMFISSRHFLCTLTIDKIALTWNHWAHFFKGVEIANEIQTRNLNEDWQFLSVLFWNIPSANFMHSRCPALADVLMLSTPRLKNSDVLWKIS